MDATTARLYVVYGMVVAGLGMGLLQPVYTVAVQNVAPREQMGAATSSTMFFRSDWQHRRRGGVRLDDAHAVSQRVHEAVPPHVPPVALPYFSNPLMLGAGAAAARGGVRARAGRRRAAADAVRQRAHRARDGLHQIFVCSAVIMMLAVGLHLALRSEPLRTRAAEPELAAH